MKDLIQHAVRASKDKIVDFRETYPEFATVRNKRECEEAQTSTDSDDEFKGCFSEDDEANQDNPNKRLG